MTIATMLDRVVREVARIKDEARYLSGMAAVSRIATAAAIEQMLKTWRPPGEEAGIAVRAASIARRELQAMATPEEHVKQFAKGKGTYERDNEEMRAAIARREEK